MGVMYDSFASRELDRRENESAEIEVVKAREDVRWMNLDRVERTCHPPKCYLFVLFLDPLIVQLRVPP